MSYDPDPIPVSVFRSHTREVLDRSERGGLPLLQRRNTQPLALIAVAELAEAFKPFEFHPEVITQQEDGTIAVWLPELEVYGNGSDLDSALDDLVTEVLLYLEDWESEGLASAPNHSPKLGWVRRLQTCAGRRSAIRDLIAPGDQDR